MIDVLQALAESRRLEIVRALRGQELSAGKIAARFPHLRRPTVSHHLSVLEEAGLVDVRREGTRRLYRLRPERFASLSRFFDSFWAEQLGQLKRSVEERRPKGKRRGGR